MQSLNWIYFLIKNFSLSLILKQRLEASRRLFISLHEAYGFGPWISTVFLTENVLDIQNLKRHWSIISFV